MVRKYFKTTVAIFLIGIPTLIGLLFDFTFWETIGISLAILFGFYLVLEIILTIIAVYIFIKTLKEQGKW